jgi:hypothetical protein
MTFCQMLICWLCVIFQCNHCVIRLHGILPNVNISYYMTICQMLPFGKFKIHDITYDHMLMSCNQMLALPNVTIELCAYHLHTFFLALSLSIVRPYLIGHGSVVKNADLNENSGFSNHQKFLCCQEFRFDCN